MEKPLHLVTVAIDSQDILAKHGSIKFLNKRHYHNAFVKKKKKKHSILLYEKTTI